MPFGWGKSEEKPKEDPSNFHKPDFYRGSDGPEFKVLESKPDDYEVRLYTSTMWVGASATQLEDYSSVTGSLFWKLFNYIRGNNEAEKKIEMTTPVRSRVELSEDGKSKFITMAFFVPSKLQANPPQPKDKEVFHAQEPSTLMYVKSFGGFANEKAWQEHLQSLKSSLDRDGKSYVKDGYYGAGYDPPYRLFGRRNEVLLVADPQPPLEKQDEDKQDGDKQDGEETAK